MPFHFSLAAVLRVRELSEQRELRVLERLLSEINLAEAKVRQAQALRDAALQKKEGELARGVPAISVQVSCEEEESLKRQEEMLAHQLRELRVKHRKQLGLYQAARRSREGLDEMRRRQFEEYVREMEKKEQRVMDDIFLSRQKRAD